MDVLLWHLKVSHYNEKARWALDYKRVPHRRRAAHAGSHSSIARKLTGGSTFPVLVLDGEAISDSTAIIAALERVEPEPPLYPDDAGERERALALEDFFDEELGPYTRKLVVHHTLADPTLMMSTFTPDLPPARRLVARAVFPLIRRKLTSDFGIDHRGVEDAYGKVRAAGERFRAELQPNGYLADDGFSVADLTLAALVAPVACPVEFPYPQPQRGHPLLEPARAALAESGLDDWARGIYARHRGTSAEIAAA